MNLMAREQLLRLNEIALTKPMSIANKNPLMVADVQFWGGDENPVPHPTSVADANARLNKVAFATCRMPPSKADKRGTNEPMRFPAVEGTAAHFNACWALWFYLAANPADPARQQAVPLFRLSPYGPRCLEHQSAVQFMKELRARCKQAGISEKFGTHFQRVGGLNELQDMGCGPAELMAIGRWASDVWKIYARRSRSRLSYWAIRQAHAAGELRQSNCRTHFG